MDGNPILDDSPESVPLAVDSAFTDPRRFLPLAAEDAGDRFRPTVSIVRVRGLDAWSDAAFEWSDPSARSPVLLRSRLEERTCPVAEGRGVAVVLDTFLGEVC